MFNYDYIRAFHGDRELFEDNSFYSLYQTSKSSLSL